MSRQSIAKLLLAYIGLSDLQNAEETALEITKAEKEIITP